MILNQIEKEYGKNIIPLQKSFPPYVPYAGGYGYEGILLENIDTEQIQCHFCGKWFKSLGTHLRYKHNHLTAEEYKEEVGLNKSTGLVSTETSVKFRINAVETMKNNKKFGLTKEARQNGEIAIKRCKNYRIMNKKRRGFTNTAEYMNGLNMCQLQLRERFMQEVKKNKGKIPPDKQCKDLYNSLRRRFGTKEIAMKRFGLSPVQCNYRKLKRPYSKKILINILRGFQKTERRLPCQKDFAAVGVLPSYSTMIKYFGTWKKAKKLAFNK